MMIAGIGAALLVVALGTIHWLRNNTERLAAQRGPAVQASMRALIGVQHSLTALHGWVELGEPSRRDERESAWSNEIRPALSRLRALDRDIIDDSNALRLQQIEEPLEDLDESQWWVMIMAQSRGNEPARLLREQRVEPVAETIESLIASMIEQEGRDFSGRGDLDLLASMSSFRQQFTECRTLFADFINGGEESQNIAFARSLEHARALLLELRGRSERFTGICGDLFATLMEEFEAYDYVAEVSAQLRLSPEWNLARKLIREETTPLEKHVTGLLNNLATNQARLMRDEVTQVAHLTNLAVVLVSILLVAMLVMALISARRNTASITQPLTTLVRATEDIAAGRLEHRLPSPDTEELARLGRAFGSMRSAIQLAQETLETRVRERTAELESMTRDYQRSQTDLEQKNQMLEQTIAAAEAATKAKSEFLANMSHEIRTPMTAILGFAEFLGERAEDEESQEAIQTITGNGRHLLELINEILDISKVESGNLEIELERVGLHELMETTRKLMDVRAKEKGLTLEVSLPGWIPETIETDPRRLRQILINLIGNAIKFTEKGGVLVVGTLDDVSSEDPMFVFSVMDSGIGMTDEQLGRIFQPFSQADASTTRRFGGTGLGLFISRRLAHMLGGDIYVSSDEGQGSLFRVDVRTGSLNGIKLVNVNEDTGSDTDAQTDPPKAPSIPKLSCHILVAEDTQANQRLISYILQKAGARVDIADNGRIAVNMVSRAANENRPYDLILMDMQMPVMDGYEAARTLKDMGSCPPIVALTANAMRTDRQKCLDAGCDGYASKPINRMILLETIVSHLELPPSTDPQAD